MNHFENPVIVMDQGKPSKAEVGSLVILGKSPVWLKNHVSNNEWDYGRKPWLDHWGEADYHGRPVLVSEPYDLPSDKVEALLAFCRKHHLEFEITATSYWYPTRTLRIIIYPAAWSFDGS